MKTEKSISTLFQKGAEQISVQPSGQAWQRLESRLEKEERRGRVVVMRWVASAAAMLVLVAAIWLWSASMRQHNFAILDAAPPQNLKDLENVDGCEPYCLVLKARAELPAYYANPVMKKN